MKHMPGDYVDIDTGETCNSLVFKRIQRDCNVRVIRKFKQILKNGKEERCYTTIEYRNDGKIWCGEIFDNEDKVNVHAAAGDR